MAFDYKLLTRTSADIVEGAVKHYDYLGKDVDFLNAGFFPSDYILKPGDIVRQIEIGYDSDGLITSYTAKEYYLVADIAGVLTATAL